MPGFLQKFFPEITQEPASGQSRLSPGVKPVTQAHSQCKSEDQPPSWLCTPASYARPSAAVLLTLQPPLRTLGAHKNKPSWQPIDSFELRTFNHAGQTCSQHRSSLTGTPRRIATIHF